MADLTEQTAPETQDKAQKKKKRKRKKIIKGVVIGVVIAALLGGGVFAWTRLNQKGDSGDGDVMTAFVNRGAITSMVEGSGVAVAKNSASVTMAAASNIIEVFVTEGDHVSAGDRLFTATSTELEAKLESETKRLESAREGVTNAVKRRDECARALASSQGELNKLLSTPRDMDAVAEYAGIVVDVKRFEVGDSVSKGQTLARLIDDSRYLLSLYFSYTYENEIYVGQPVEVSIPVLMAQLPGKVSEIHKVERLAPEGSKLFEVLVELENPGTLTAEMIASATIAGSADTIYPYESGVLEVYRSKEITAPMDGKIGSFRVYNYSRVAAGESIARILGSGLDDEIAAARSAVESAESMLRGAEEGIKTAEANVTGAEEGVNTAKENLANLDAVAPIDGTVLSVGVFPGDEVKTGHVAISIADTSTMVINANVDEMNVSNIRTGMMVQLDQWGQIAFGVVESVSLSGNYENGVSRFPVVISVDNSDDLLRPGSYVSYSFTASQSDDCLLVPVQCVKYVETEEGRQKAVFVRSELPPENAAELSVEMLDIPEGFWPVLVETGISDSSNVELLSPELEEGTEVFQAKVRTDNMW